MTDTWFVSDTHFGHYNMIIFKDKKGNKIRPFSSIEEHDETLVENWNKLISPKDRVYHLGDVVIHRRCLPILNRLNGRKKLIKGNHDIFKLKDYTPYFEDIAAYRPYPDSGILVSHIPVHTSQLEHRFKMNVHGHLHSNVLDDKRYLNICLEHTEFKPVNYEHLLKIKEEREL